jgi:cell division protein FtsI/penicillin-binding protein 2
VAVEEASDGRPRAEVPFTAHVVLDGLGQWDYDGQMSLVEADGEWRVDWSPTTIHPALDIDDWEIRRSREWPERAPIFDGAGQPIVSSGQVVEVGVEPRRITDRGELAAAVEQYLDIPPEDLFDAIDAPGVQPTYFVPLAQLPPTEWALIEGPLLPVPGIVIRDAIGRKPPSPDFMIDTLGRFGEVTAERLEELGAPYAVGDLVGSGGIEGTYEERLAGSPSGSVLLLNEFGDVVNVLAEFDGTNPLPVATTIDPAVQAAAEAAIAGAPDLSAIVAVDGRDGAVLGAVSKPLGGFHRGIEGRYPPGSTFKIVTAYGLLGNGVTPESVLPCPSSINVGGRDFSNFEGGALGDAPFRDIFRLSCNTGFIAAADEAGEDALLSAAEQLGFTGEYSIGLPTFPGSFPEVADSTENAAAAIGQGRVEASPLHMASVAAAIASGTWHPPFLVREPPVRPRPRAHELDPAITGTIRSLMQDVVASGTGTAAAVPGRTMGGKTGTAQFDPNNPDNTHAWFVGWVESAGRPVGFAVLVEGGGVGGRVAAPIAHDFVAALP